MGVIQVTNSGHDPMSIEYIKIHSGDLSSLDGPPIDENNDLSKRTKSQELVSNSTLFFTVILVEGPV